MMRTEFPFDASAFVEQGPKPVVTGRKAAVSTDSAIVTRTALQVMASGGTAADAAVAACLTQATVEPFMTNHAGTVVFLYWDAGQKQLFALDSAGVLLPGRPAFRPVPSGQGGYAFAGAPAPMACIPGFMPGLKAIFERFCTWRWADLCADAVAWAESGHPVSSFEYCVNLYSQPFSTYFPEGRAFFMPDGFLPPVGAVARNDALAETLRRLAREGPDYFISGGWAKAFVAAANGLGWPVALTDLSANPPRWDEPLVYETGGRRVAQFGPPQQQGVFCALILGILDALGVEDIDGAEGIYFMAHLLRWGLQQMGNLHDPRLFETPTDVWLDPNYHRHVARLFETLRPRVDLSEHVRLTSSPASRHATGFAGDLGASTSRQPTGSCELAIVDSAGNWVQMMNTLQSGGIPGLVVEGVPMVGSHVHLGDVGGGFSGWVTPGGRMRLPLASSMILGADGAPVLSTGSPGNVHCTPPQVLRRMLRGTPPDQAIAAPRMLPLEPDGGLAIETRISRETADGLAARGVRLKSLGDWDWHMGSYQTVWRDADRGLLSAAADPRRCGVAGGLEA